MTPDDSRQSIESTTDSQAETDSSPSRRGVLKTAATSMLGLAGLAVATEATNATQLITQSMDTMPSTDSLPTFDRYVAVYGDGDDPGTYEIATDGALLVGMVADVDATHNPDVIEADQVIRRKPLVIDGARVKGWVRPGRADNYILNDAFEIETGSGVVYRDLPLK